MRNEPRSKTTSEAKARRGGATTSNEATSSAEGGKYGGNRCVTRSSGRTHECQSSGSPAPTVSSGVGGRAATARGARSQP